jgi:hypothetical protein
LPANIYHVPQSGLPRNKHPGSTWYPLERAMPLLTYMVDRQNFGGDIQNDTGGNFVKRRLAEIPALNLPAANMVVQVNSMKYAFTGQNYLPPVAEALGPVDQGVWETTVMPLRNEEVQEAEEKTQGDLITAKELQITNKALQIVAKEGQITAVQADQASLTGEPALTQAQVQALLDAEGLTNVPFVMANALAMLQGHYTGEILNFQAELVVLQGELVNLQAQLVPLLAALQVIKSYRFPAFEEWMKLPTAFDYRMHFTMTGVPAMDVAGTNLIFDDKALLVPMVAEWWDAARVAGFRIHNDAPDHTRFPYTSAPFRLICDTQRPTATSIAAVGDLHELFSLTWYYDHAATESKSLKFGGVRVVPSNTTALLIAEHQAAYDAANAAQVAAQQAYDADGSFENEMALARANELKTEEDALLFLHTNSIAEWSEASGIGDLLQVDTHDPIAVSANSFYPTLVASANNRILLQDFVIGYETTRYFFLQFNNIGIKSDKAAPRTLVFSSDDCKTFAMYHDVCGNAPNQLHLCTEVLLLYASNGAGGLAPVTSADITAYLGDSHGAMRHSIGLGVFGAQFQSTWFGGAGIKADPITVFDDRKAESLQLGPVFRSQKRISQHLCAPILNPNARIGCAAPLNYETMHLPPELRNFRLELNDVKFDFLPGKKTLESMIFYEFNGGNQDIAAEDNLLHLPQFREFSTSTIGSDGSFDFEMFSPYGMPSYFAVFARDHDFSRDHERQPMIKQLNVMCNTTMKKSNTILDANVHELYHITQRNVHPRSEYHRAKFDERQVILLSAEDVGLLGLELNEYQNEKRAVFRFQGIVDQISRVTVLLIYTNRGLYVKGKQLSVVRLN